MRCLQHCVSTDPFRTCQAIVIEVTDRPLGKPQVPLENPLHHARADAELPADLEDAVTLRPQLQYSRLHHRRDAAASQLRSLGSGTCEASVNSLANDPPLELTEYAEHLKHRFARGRGRVEALLVKEQTAPLFMKALENTEQVG